MVLLHTEGLEDPNKVSAAEGGPRHPVEAESPLTRSVCRMTNTEKPGKAEKNKTDSGMKELSFIGMDSDDIG